MPKESNAPKITKEYESDPELAAHLASLGLETVEQYQAWCAGHHLSTRVDKHWRQRCQERYLAAQSKVSKRLQQKKRERRAPRRILAAVFDTAVSEDELTQPYLVQIHQSYATIDAAATKLAFRQLILCAEARTKLLSANTGFQAFGPVAGNTFIDALLALSRHHTHWLRPVETWKCQSRNVSKQFSSLARHLLAKYAVPLFMDSAWFLGNDPTAAQHQDWFVRLGNGDSPRKLDLPLKLTKRMAHHFLLAPNHYSLNEALRYGQVVGLGGDRRLAEAVLSSRIGRDFENTEFWQSNVHWLARHPFLDPSQVGPLVDYIHRCRFEPDKAGFEGGEQFSIRGRTPTSLLRQMHEWHAALRIESKADPDFQWVSSGIDPFEWTEGVPESKSERHWTIIELLCRDAVFREGRSMRHCVASYANLCACGGTSIWSLGVERAKASRRRKVTIEVATLSRSIRQVRGRGNRQPNQKERDLITRWADQAGLFWRS